MLLAPYVLVPDFTLQVQLHEQINPEEPIGTVTGVQWEGMRHQRIGTAKAWYYPLDRILVLWEVDIHNHYRGVEEEATKGPNLAAIWRACEGFLMTQFPDAERIVTPSWEPSYENWQGFLALQGYQPFPGEEQA